MLSKRILKILHEVGTVGVMGAVLAQIVLANLSADLSLVEYATMRHSIMLLARWMLLPSLALVLVSGTLAMALHRPFHNAEWVWVKALMTPLLLEGTFMLVDRPARVAARLSARLADGDESARAGLMEALRQERWGVWVLAVLFLGNIVISVWRPRLRPRSEPVSATSVS